MEQDFDLKHWEDRNCPKVDCKKNACKCGIKKVFLPAALGDDSAKSPIAPKNGAYCNAIVVYEANDHVYIYSTEGIPTLITVEGGSSEEAIEELTRRLNSEILNRGAADNVLQGEIDDKQNKLTAGANITIDSDNEISATDTTYSNFTGTDGIDPGTAGLVPAPATTDAGKFLKADGTWDTAGGSSVTVVQTTGTSQADVMSQNATTSMVYADPSTMYKVNIGAGNTIDSSATAGVIIGKNAQIQSGADESIRIGSNGLCYGPYSIAIGYNAQSAAGTYGNTTGSIAIGRDAVTRNGGEVSIGASASTLQSGLYGAVNLGAYSRATRGGEVNVGSTNTMYGYNSTNYRVIGGVHDGQSAHDAATVGQLNGRVLQNDGAPTTATVGTVGQLLEDTTNGKLYQCTAIDTTDPNNPSYTWSEVGAGGGGGGGFVTLTSADYNYPAGNPTAVNPGMMSPGIYFIADDSVYVYDGIGSGINKSNEVFIISKSVADSTMHEMMVINDGHGAPGGSYRIEFYYVDIATGSTQKRGGANSYGILDGSYVVDNLITNDSKRVLSAAQGKALNDKITKTPYYIAASDLPAVGGTASGKSLFVSRNMGSGDKTNGQYFTNILNNTNIDHTWKLIVVDYYGSTKDLELFVTGVTKSLNIVTPSPTDNLKAMFTFSDGTATRTLTVWAEGTGNDDYYYSLV